MGHSRSAVLPKASQCESAGCIEAATKVISYLNETVDPCENFYKFACGNFIENTQVPVDKDWIDSIAIVSDFTQEQIRIILNEPPQLNEPKSIQLVKQFNAACMNQTIIENRAIMPLSELLESFGGWPVVKGNAWSEDDFDWVETMKQFRRTGIDVNFIFSFVIQTDPKNSTKRVLTVSICMTQFHIRIDLIILLLFILQIYQPDHKLMYREFLVQGLSNEYVSNYLSVMRASAVFFGASYLPALKEPLAALEFEIALGNVSGSMLLKTSIS